MMKLVLVDYRTGGDILTALRKLGIEGIRGPKCSSLPWQTDGHPDLFYHKVDEEIGIVAPDVYSQLMPLLCGYGEPLKGRIFLKGTAELGKEYPQDVRYNFLRIGNKAFGRLDAMDEVLRLELERRGVELVHVKQGYAKCSVAVVSETSCITADKGLASALWNNGLTVLNLSLIHI